MGEVKMNGEEMGARKRGKRWREIIRE